MTSVRSGRAGNRPIEEPWNLIRHSGTKLRVRCSLTHRTMPGYESWPVPRHQSLISGGGS